MTSSVPYFWVRTPVRPSDYPRVLVMVILVLSGFVITAASASAASGSCDGYGATVFVCDAIETVVLVDSSSTVDIAVQASDFDRGRFQAPDPALTRVRQPFEHVAPSADVFDAAQGVDDEATVATKGVGAYAAVSVSYVYDSPADFVAPRTIVDEVASTGLWSRSSFNGTRVYQRNDLIDPGLVDGVGRSNLERMQSGLAPIGPDGKSLNLHHALQTNDSAIVEMTQTFHQTNSRVIHINPSSVPSGIDRSAFNAWRRDYWRSRACDFGGC